MCLFRRIKILFRICRIQLGMCKRRVPLLLCPTVARTHTHAARVECYRVSIIAFDVHVSGRMRYAIVEYYTLCRQIDNSCSTLSNRSIVIPAHCCHHYFIIFQFFSFLPMDEWRTRYNKHFAQRQWLDSWVDEHINVYYFSFHSFSSPRFFLLLAAELSASIYQFIFLWHFPLFRLMEGGIQGNDLIRWNNAFARSQMRRGLKV